MQLRAATGTADPTTTEAPAAVKTRRLGGINWSYTLRSWLGFIPFLLFCLLFELLPAAMIIEGSFVNSNTGTLTLNNYQRMLSQSSNLHAFQTSISLSLVTALIGAVIGFFAAYGVYNLRTSWLR
ncbi:MAG: hypothetical protein ACJ8BW_32515, partial [Ktedonobacteraceae bacterium]